MAVLSELSVAMASADWVSALAAVAMVAIGAVGLLVSFFGIVAALLASLFAGLAYRSSQRALGQAQSVLAIERRREDRAEKAEQLVEAIKTPALYRVENNVLDQDLNYVTPPKGVLTCHNGTRGRIYDVLVSFRDNHFGRGEQEPPIYRALPDLPAGSEFVVEIRLHGYVDETSHLRDIWYLPPGCHIGAPILDVFHTNEQGTRWRRRQNGTTLEVHD